MKYFTLKKKRYSEEYLMGILLYPIVSEKAIYIFKKYKKIIFIVNKNSNKFEIKLAIELLFNTTVISIKILNRIGKKKQYGKVLGNKKKTRRAFIAFKNIKNINFLQNILK